MAKKRSASRPDRKGQPQEDDTRNSEYVNKLVDDFPSRLQAAIDQTFGSRGKRAFADAAGIKEPTLHDYLKGKSLPNIETAVRMAIAGQCGLEWLITGIGDPHPRTTADSEEGTSRLGAARGALTMALEQIVTALDAVGPLLSKDEQDEIAAALQNLGQRGDAPSG